MKYQVSDSLLNLVPYSPGKPIGETQREYGVDRVIKLASNENPLGPSPLAIQAMQAALVDLHRYPDAAFYDLRQGFADYLRVEPKQLTFGNGSNELIDHLIRVFCSEGRGVLTSEKAFIAYQISARIADVPVFETPLTEDFRFDIAALVKTLREKGDQIGLIFLPNPNNPTGTFVTRTELFELTQLLRQFPHVVLVLDEAYAEFVDAEDAPQGIQLIQGDPQICVMRTLSKVFGLAGVRIGALIGDPELISLIDRVRNPFNVNSLAQAGAIATLLDAAYLAEVVRVNREGRKAISEGLAELGLFFCPSQANFVFFDSQRPAQLVFEALLKKGVIIRPLLNYGFRTQLRVSVGLPEENQLFLLALKATLGEISKTEQA